MAWIRHLGMSFAHTFRYSGRSSAVQARPLLGLWGWATVIGLGMTVYGYSKTGGLSSLAMSGLWVAAIASLVCFLPLMAMTVRRLHDQDHSAWFLLLGLIPSVGPLILVFFISLPGSTQPNRYGPAPN